MNQKGFIPIIYIIIGALIIASAIFGAIYKDEITASVYKILKPKIVIYNIIPTAKLPPLSEGLPAELFAGVTDPPVGEADPSVDEADPSVGEADPSVGETCPSADEAGEIKELKKQIEALKQQPPKIIYKEVIKEVPVQTSAPTLEPELVPLSTPISFQDQSEVTSNNSGQVPDLFVRSPVYYPSPIIKGDVMSFFATIKNQGEGLAGPSIVSLSIDGVTVGKASTMTLASNRAETITWGKIWRATLGIHAFEICADADSEITESDEKNNCRSYKFSVLKTLPLPDYIIKSTTMAPKNAVPGSILSFEATVHNQGSSTGAGTSFTSLKIDIGNNGDWNVPAKNAVTDTLDQGINLRKRWDFAWAATPGTHKYKICADATFYIKELDETNNCISKIFTVP